MSQSFTPAFAKKILRGVTDERLAVITYQAFQTTPCAVFLPSAIGIRLIAQEKARRAQARRAPPAKRVPAPAPAISPQPEAAPVAAPAPVQIGLFE